MSLPCTRSESESDRSGILEKVGVSFLAVRTLLMGVSELERLFDGAGVKSGASVGEL